MCTMSIRPTPTAAVPAGDGRLKEVLAHGQNLQAVEPEGVCTGGRLFNWGGDANKKKIEDLHAQVGDLKEQVKSLEEKLFVASEENTKLLNRLKQIAQLACSGENGLKEE